MIECTALGGFDLVIARTGYTGEDVGYEMFVHPERAVAFWETLLRGGRAFRPAARRPGGTRQHAHRGRPAALRPRAGGQFDISPAGAGFGAYVKLHKPYFIGRDCVPGREKTRNMEVARFRMNERGVRMPKTGDPVITRRARPSAG